LAIDDKLQIGTWNVRGICNKVKEIQKETNESELHIIILTETKEKLKGTQELAHFMLIYSWVPQRVRAQSGVAILISHKWKNKIHSYKFINDRIITVRRKVPRGYLTVICIYAPEEGRNEDSDEFYETLQKEINSTNKNDYLILGGDLNARIGNNPIPDLIGTNGEPTLNKNGQALRDFVPFNELKITNTFFRHKDIDEYTWHRGNSKTLIDYIIVNKKLKDAVTDTRVCRGKDINSDHYLLISKINIFKRWKNDLKKN
jgi:exonuclease III